MFKIKTTEELKNLKFVLIKRETYKKDDWALRVFGLFEGPYDSFVVKEYGNKKPNDDIVRSDIKLCVRMLDFTLRNLGMFETLPFDFDKNFIDFHIIDETKNGGIL